MKRATTIAVAAAALAASAPLAAKNVTADVDQIAAILQQEGYQAKRAGKGSEPRIETSMEGYTAAIYFFGCNDQGKDCKSVQFYAGFNPKTNPSLDAMNKYSQENRFGWVYLDSEGDPVIEMDLDLEAGGMSEELFIDNMAYWTTIMSKFADMVFKAE